MCERDRNANRGRAVAVLLVAVLATASCGYHFTGTGALLPPGTASIAVPAFINNTNEPYLDVEVTKAAIAEFIADGRLHVEDVETAELVLRGTVARFDVTPMSYTASTYVQQYRVRIVVGAQLLDQRTKKVLWQDAGIEAVFISEYKVVLGDISSTKAFKEDAIKKAAQDIAWTLRSRVLEGF